MKKWAITLAVYCSTLVIDILPQQPSWEIVSTGTTEDLNSVYFYDYETGYACGNSGTVIKSIDSGKTLQIIQTPVTNNLNDLYVFDQNTVTVVGDSGTILFSTDGGSNWFTGPNLLTDNYLSVSFSGNKGICGGSSQTILYGIYEGTSLTWIVTQSGFFGGGFWGAVMLSPEIGFIAGENSIFQPLLGMSTDSGQNWNFSAFYLNNSEGRATGVDFTDMFLGYVSARVWDGRGAISKTMNSGSDWITTFFNNPLWDIDFPVSATGLIGYAVGDSGAIYKTYNAGLNWQTQQSGTFARLNEVHFLDLDYGFAVGENGTLLRTTTGGEPVTGMANNSELPVDFKLEQNYPNPFNPSTKIKFTLPPDVRGGRQEVSLKVYDVLGREITTLINKELPAGEYEIEFNIGQESIPVLTTGIYFYQLKTGKFVNTKKMLLLR